MVGLRRGVFSKRMCFFCIESGGLHSANSGKFGFGTYKPGTPQNPGSVTVDTFMAWDTELSAADVEAVYNDQN